VRRPGATFVGAAFVAARLGVGLNQEALPHFTGAQEIGPVDEVMRQLGGQAKVVVVSGIVRHGQLRRRAEAKVPLVRRAL